MQTRRFSRSSSVSSSRSSAPASSSLPSSSPLSCLAQSPSLPSPCAPAGSSRYPSPISNSALSGSASPLKRSHSGNMDEISVRTDEPPRIKRRRIAKSPRNRPRTTERIDLENRDEKQDEELERLLSALRKKKKIVVIAGAGISVSAGIPDFRSSAGLYATSGKHLFDASVYKNDATTSSFHNMVRDLAAKAAEAKPTAFHHMLASMAQEDRLLRLYSQNVDCIETRLAPLATNVPLGAKGPWPKTIQLHGGLEKMVCTKCNTLKPFQASLFQGPELPLCEVCTELDEVRVLHGGKRSHGIGRLRPRIVLYNEFDHPDAEAIGTVSKADLKRVPDAVIVVGTSLKVPGARRLVKEMCQLTRSRRDGITAWINIDSEPQGFEFKDCWDFIIRGKCDDVAGLAGLPRWHDLKLDDAEEYMVSGNQDKEMEVAEMLKRDRVDVVLELPERTRETANEPTPPGSCTRVTEVESGIPTPRASPKLRKALPASRPQARRRATPPQQSMLSFAGHTTKATEKVPATTTAKSRTPLPTKRRASRSLTQAFKATKKATSVESKRAVKDEESDDSQGTRGRRVRRLPALRPSSTAGNLDRNYYVPDPDSSSEHTKLTVSPPSTPVLRHRPAIDIISPKSKPHNMENLIH